MFYFDHINIVYCVFYKLSITKYVRVFLIVWNVGKSIDKLNTAGFAILVFINKL